MEKVPAAASSVSNSDMSTNTNEEINPASKFKVMAAEILRQNKLMDEVYNLSREITFESKGVITQLHKYKEVTFKHPPPS